MQGKFLESPLAFLGIGAHVGCPQVWGIMPVGNEKKCNFKLAELHGKRGRNPKSKIDGYQQLTMKEASKPTPFFVMLYFSTGFGGYLCSRFSINRRTTPLRNRLEYIRQALGMLTGVVDEFVLAHVVFHFGARLK